MNPCDMMFLSVDSLANVALIGWLLQARLLEMHKAILRQKLSVLESEGVSAVLATDTLPSKKDNRCVARCPPLLHSRA